MFDNISKNISQKTQGIIGIVIGIIILFGALINLGVFTALIHTIMIIAGIVLLFWGLEKSELLQHLKKQINKQITK